MDTTQILRLVTVVVSLVLGFIAKKSKYINNHIIPVQNLTIGVAMTIINYVITGDFDIAIACGGLFAGGIYDLPNNLAKLKDEN